MNQINSRLWSWQASPNWPPRSHALICGDLLSTLQFDKQDLRWSLPHAQHFPLCVDPSRELQQSALQHPEGKGVMELHLEEDEVPLLETIICSCTLLLLSPDSGRSGGWGRGAGREEEAGWAERPRGCSSAGPGGKRFFIKQPENPQFFFPAGFVHLNVTMLSKAGDVPAFLKRVQKLLKIRSLFSWFPLVSYSANIWKHFSTSTVSAWNYHHRAPQWRWSLSKLFLKNFVLFVSKNVSYFY